jgi:hypothetical protein
MSFSKKAAKILTNKYFLYFTVFLAIITIFGYLLMNRLTALIVFLLIGVITYQFSKNMAVVLLVCILATNLLISSRIVKEGLENASDSSTTNNNSKKAATAATAATAAAITSSAISSDNPITPPHMYTDTNENNEHNEHTDSNTDEPAPVEVNPTNGMVGGKTTMNGSGSRIDYASTLEEAYDNLDKILGSDGIQNLTQDTKKLMAQQQALFKSMESMAPMLETAQNMLKGFDLDSLKGIAGIASKVTNAN